MIYTQIFDMVNVGIVILDTDLKVYKWNRWMETHSNILSDKIIGASIFDFFPNLNAPWFKRNCKSITTFGNFAFFSQKLHGYCFPFKAVNTLGSTFELMQQNCTMGPLRDEGNHIKYIYIMVQDVTEVAVYEQKLIEMNTKDSLTGVYNRRHFETKLAEEFERHKRYENPFSMIMIDIDFFKKINDSYGHQCGDYILKSLTQLIVNRMRSIDFLARYGGEEFCCLLPETDIHAALRLAENFRIITEKHTFQFKDNTLKITISQGVSEMKRNVKNTEALLKLADDALYEAKRAGRNKVVAMKAV